jgi:type I restriction enzyme M protein
VILLMARLVLNGDKEILQREGVLRSVYDPACGTGGMLSIAEDYIHEAMNPAADIRLYGQEINDETYAVCVSDMLIKGDDEGAKNIKARSTFTHDGHPGRTFDYMLCYPPLRQGLEEGEGLHRGGGRAGARREVRGGDTTHEG